MLQHTPVTVQPACCFRWTLTRARAGEAGGSVGIHQLKVLLASDQGKQQLMDTIVVPHHIRNLQKELPKPCFPDTRPNSPEVWPVGAEGPGGAPRDQAVAQKAANDKDRGGRAPPTDRAPGTAMPIQPKGSAAQLHAEHRAPAYLFTLGWR